MKTLDKIKEEYEAEIVKIYPDGIPEGMYLFNVMATMYMPYTGNVTGSVQFFDMNGQQVVLESEPCIMERTPYQNKRLYIMQAKGIRGSIYENGIPYLLTEEERDRITSIRIAWNTVYDTHNITMTELCNIAFEKPASDKNETKNNGRTEKEDNGNSSGSPDSSSNVKRVYELRTGIIATFDMSHKENSWTEVEDAYLKGYTDYCIFFMDNYMRDIAMRKITMIKGAAESKAENIIANMKKKLKEHILDKNRKTDIFNDLLLRIYYPYPCDDSEPMPDQYYLDRFLVPGADLDTLADGIIEKGMYRLIVSIQERKLSPMEYPVESFCV